MTTLVTGGRGFVGRHLVDQLLQIGEEVVSYNRDFAVDNRPGVAAVQGELFDLPRLTRALTEHVVDRIIHTAGQSHPGISVEIPMTTFAANADGTLAVYEAARMAGVRRVVNFSSECALGNLDPDVIVDEQVTPRPTTPYGVSKVAGELLGRVYNDLYGMEIVSLRITEVYGPGLWMPSVLADMVRAAVTGETFVLAEGGDHPFQFVYVADVATAARLASIAVGPPMHVYNISGGRRIDLRGTSEILSGLIPGARFEIGPGFLPRWDRQGAYDLTASARDLGYRAQWTLDRGLAATLDSFQASVGRP